MQSMALVSIFGVLGILSRYGVDSYFYSWNEKGPITTLVINILGSFLAGLIYALSTYREFSSTLQSALLIGFCGGFTTFSAYTLQTLMLIEKGKVSLALSYLVLSPAIGLLAAFIPYIVVRKLLA